MPVALGAGVVDHQCLGRQPRGELLLARGVDDLVLEAAYQHLGQCRRVGRHTSGETVRVQQLQQRLPGLAVTVVRGGRQQHPVLALPAELAYRLGLTAVNGVAAATFGRRRGRTVVRLVDDEQVEEWRAARASVQHLVEQTLDPRCAQPGQADDHAWVDGEGVGLQPVGAAHRGEGSAVQDGEVQAELVAHLLLPLDRQRRRADDEHPAGAVAQQHLVDDQAGFDGLAETDVVGD